MAICAVAEKVSRKTKDQTVDEAKTASRSSSVVTEPEGISMWDAPARVVTRTGILLEMQQADDRSGAIPHVQDLWLRRHRLENPRKS